MQVQNTKIILGLLLTMFTLGTPTAFLFVYNNTNSIRDAIKASLLYIVILVVSSLVTRVWRVFDEEHLTTWVREKLRFLLSDHESRYLEYVIAKNNYIDTRLIVGAEIQHHFDLHEAYVPLVFEKINQSKENNQNYDIFQYIKNNKQKEGSKVVIIGQPGSGKTTLIRYLALLLAERKKNIISSSQIPNKLPILISLAEHVPQIQKNNKITLANLIEIYYEEKGVRFPSGWLHKQLQNGRCAVLIDGLDVVALSSLKQEVVNWVQQQMTLYAKSRFVISSRPQGYTDNPLLGVTVLQVKDFSFDQVEQFVNNWYLANEKERSKQDDPYVKIRAQEGAQKLIYRLRENTDLHKLSTNPLLLTMISIVFSVRENLPGKRVELYEDMIEVSLQQKYRLSFDAINDPLTRLQKEQVLQRLAYHMMIEKTTKIKTKELQNVIRTPLSSISSHLKGDEFVKLIETVYGLLVEKENGEYAFTHQTFQEYLASRYIVRNKRYLQVLLDSLGDSWWEETIRLYSAQTDATKIIEKCLEIEPIPIPVLRLATNILAEALEMKPKIRNRLESILDKYANEPFNSDRHALSSIAKLSSRIRFMKSINPIISIDDSFVTNIEYQLFLDEMQDEGNYYYPDHWPKPIFEQGQALEPVTGIRPTDAVAFCKWLTEFDIGPTNYRIPTSEEAEDEPIVNSKLTYFVKPKDNEAINFLTLDITPLGIYKEDITKLFSSDIEDIKRLKSAIERKKIKAPKSSEILARTQRMPISASSYGIGKKQTTGIPLPFNFDEIRENRLLLESYETFSELLELQLEIFTNILYTNLIQKLKGYNFNWLPPYNKRSISTYDIGTSCKGMLESFDVHNVERVLPNSSQHVLLELSKILQLVYSRNWFQLSNLASIDSKEFYKFLRWHIRISLLQLITHLYENVSENKAYSTSQKMLEVLTHGIYDFYLLEKRIQQKPLEAIRLVKEKKQFDIRYE